MSVHRLRPLSGVAVVVAAAAALSGCSDRRAAEATPPAPSTTAATPASAATSAPAPAPSRTETWTALQAGDCLAAPPSTDPAVVTVDVVDCAVPHLAEVFLRANIPVDTALSDTANRQCGAGLLQYTGTSPAGGGYTITYLIDSDQDRTSNNPYPSTVICLLQGTQGQALTGSARR